VFYWEGEGGRGTLGLFVCVVQVVKASEDHPKSVDLIKKLIEDTRF